MSDPANRPCAHCGRVMAARKMTRTRGFWTCPKHSPEPRRMVRGWWIAPAFVISLPAGWAILKMIGVM